MAEHTPEPWEATDRPGQGWQIRARVPHLDRAVTIQEVPIRPQVTIGDDGKVYVTVSYESFNQFPSDDWLKMQAANAILMAAAPELLKACMLADRADQIGNDGTCAKGTLTDKRLMWDQTMQDIRAAIAKAEAAP